MMERFQMTEQKQIGLSRARAEYEKNLRPVSVINQMATQGNVLVILTSTTVTPGKNSETGEKKVHYHCHRYFPLGDNWHVSIDGHDVELDAVFSWLNYPCALTTQRDEYIVPSPVVLDKR